MSYRDTKEWHEVHNKEFIKLLIADLRRIRADIEVRTLNYDPLNPDEALDIIFQLVKEMGRDLDVLYQTYLEEWAEAVKEARGGKEFTGEEAADLEHYRNLIKTQQMGRSKRNGWRRHK